MVEGGRQRYLVFGPSLAGVMVRGTLCVIVPSLPIGLLSYERIHDHISAEMVLAKLVLVSQLWIHVLSRHSEDPGVCEHVV